MNLSLTEADLANLILQRTGPFVNLGGRKALGQWFATGEKVQLARFLQGIGKVNEYAAAVFAEINAEFKALEPYFRDTGISAVSSIGPGLGIFELLIYKSRPAHLLLIDIEQSINHQHGFAQEGSGYASLQSSRNFLISNGVSDVHVEVCNPRHQPLPSQSFDLLISFISMGFHYPCDEYVAFILAGLRRGGMMVFDKRAGEADAGWRELEPHFEVLAQFPSPKSTRMILTRK